MPKPDTYSYSYKELAELLIKAAGVKDGYWGVQITFGLKGSNIGPDKDNLVPGALLIVQKIGLQPFKEETSLSVDAATVWAEENE